jgi:hydrogenase maturation protein HypF
MARCRNPAGVTGFLFLNVPGNEVSFHPPAMRVLSCDQFCRIRSQTTSNRISVTIQGIVQGVGFRPFVYRLAVKAGLTGWVRNTPSGVFLEAQGPEEHLHAFLEDLRDKTPPLAVISSIETEEIPTANESAFIILKSGGGENSIQIAPDGDVCPDCLRELFDPADRRYRYPFINCTNCGPRYTIITGVPYDRPFTTMASFPLCPLCRAEYGNPADRRFHAQPVACPVCGPRLELLGAEGKTVAGDPLETAISLLREGKILAIKGLGGYHLAVDACNAEAVRELRARKKRDEKPFAVMSADVADVAGYALFDRTEQRLLEGVEKPIVLLRKRQGNPIAPLVAPANGYFGVTLPSTPLHHLLLRGNFRALVMTSGNLSDEPIAYRDEDARERLQGIADFYLVHDRGIHTRTDDSVIRVFQGNPIFLRRSRGYVPRAIVLPSAQRSVLAVGAELKGTVCLTRGDRAFLSQHIGDLQNDAVLRSLAETVDHLERILSIRPEVVAHDLHPDYLSTVYAQSLSDLPCIPVQHHHAHLASCMAEHRLEGEVIGVIFDGTGFGTDGTIWGGEFLVGGYDSFRRWGHFRQVPMPGGDAAVREPFRMAFAYLHAAFGEGLYDLPLSFLAEIPAEHRKLFLSMVERRINSPLTSSCGRLFDAVASLVGLRNRVSYEGQAAIELEALAEENETGCVYPFALQEDGDVTTVDFSPMFRTMVRDRADDVECAATARGFHNTLAAATSAVCDTIRRKTGLERVVLSGGVFQNKLLTEGILTLLTEQGFQVFIQRLAPPNDGGLALGQAIIAGRSI